MKSCIYRRGKGVEGAAPGSACRCLSQTAHGCRGLAPAIFYTLPLATPCRDIYKYIFSKYE